MGIHRTTHRLFAIALLALASACGGTTENSTGSASRISMDSQGFQANGASTSPSISADGKLIAFVSNATDILLGDSNGVPDLFLHNTATGTNTFITWNAGGFLPNGASNEPALSADGQFVAFTSAATDLLPASADTNNQTDIFLYTVASATTQRVSLRDNDLQTGGASTSPSISADGSKIAFISLATDLTQTTDSNGAADIFVRNTVANSTTWVSLRDSDLPANGGSSEPAISGDGRFVAFTSTATDLVISDSNAVADVFIRDLTLNTTTRISLRDNDVETFTGASGSPSISNDGNLVVFTSAATDLVLSDINGVADIFIRNRAPGIGTTTRLSVDSAGLEADGPSANPKISSDGRYVLFTSDATDLVPNDTNGITDLFLRDRSLNTTTRVSNGIDDEANGASGNPTIAYNSATVSWSAAFDSNASNLVVSDTNNASDIFTIPIP
jgi:Tol biopolymer transport system component